MRSFNRSTFIKQAQTSAHSIFPDGSHNQNDHRHPPLPHQENPLSISTSPIKVTSHNALKKRKEKARKTKVARWKIPR